MHIFIVYCHPSKDSFTDKVKNEFIRGLIESGNTYEISDLYKMNFNSDISEEEYLREANYILEKQVPADIIIEQKKIQKCDSLVFIYPLFWTEAPAKLVGWFDRVWTYGFAYGKEDVRSMKVIEKSLILCITGHTKENLENYGHLKSIENVMIRDRLFNKTKKAEIHIFDGMTKYNDELRKMNWDNHLKKAYDLGLKINN